MNSKLKIRNFLIILIVALIFGLVAFVAIITVNGRKLTNNGTFVNTSIIRINSFPDDPTAYINGEKVRITEGRIENINPGEVVLKLEKSGYTTWEKKITLEAGIVKDVYVRLYPEELKFEQISNSNIDRIFFSANTDHIFYTILDSEVKSDPGIWKLKLTKNLLGIGNNVPTKIASFDTQLVEKLKKDGYEIVISSDNNRLIFSQPKENSVRIYETNTQAQFIDLATEIGYAPDSIHWFRNSDSVVILEGKMLFEYEIASKQMTLIHYFGDNEAIYGVNANIVYYFRKDQNKIYQYLNKNSIAVKLPTKFKIPEKLKSLIAHKSNSDILIIIDDTTEYFLDLKRGFMDNFAQLGEIVSMSNNGKSYIYKAEDGYHTYILEDTFNNKSYTSSKKLININKDEVETIYFTPNGGNIIALLNNKDKGRTLWLLDYDGQNPKELINEKTISGKVSQTSNDGNELYLLLEDSIENTAKENTRKNIYKLSLKAQ